MRIIFNIIWWMVVIIGLANLGSITDGTEYFNTIEEAEAFINSSEVAGLQVQQNSNTAEDAPPYMVVIPSEKELDDLNILQLITVGVAVIQLFKLLLLALRFIWLIIAPEKEPIEPEFVAIIFFW